LPRTELIRHYDASLHPANAKAAVEVRRQQGLRDLGAAQHHVDELTRLRPAQPGGRGTRSSNSGPPPAPWSMRSTGCRRQSMNLHANEYATAQRGLSEAHQRLARFRRPWPGGRPSAPSPTGSPARTSRPSRCAILTGALRVWIDVGAPDAARLHKAGQGGAARRRLHAQGPLAPGPTVVRASASTGGGARAVQHRSGAAPRLTARLKRRMVLAVAVAGGRLHVTIDGDVIEGGVERHALAGR